LTCIKVVPTARAILAALAQGQRIPMSTGRRHFRNSPTIPGVTNSGLRNVAGRFRHARDYTQK